MSFLKENAKLLVRPTIIADEIEVGRLDKGEVFGEMGVLEKEPRSASVVTAVDSILLKIPEAVSSI